MKIARSIFTAIALGSLLAASAIASDAGKSISVNHDWRFDFSSADHGFFHAYGAVALDSAPKVYYAPRADSAYVEPVARTINMVSAAP